MNLRQTSLSWVKIFPLLLFLTSCGSKGAVSLLAQLESPRLVLESGILSPSLGGQFDLVLELGSYAPSSTTVELGTFAVRRESSTLIEVLRLSGSETFPVELEPGDRRRIAFTVEAGGSLTEGVKDAVCEGPVRIEGVLTDTLSEGRPTPAESGAFAPECS